MAVSPEALTISQSPGFRREVEAIFRRIAPPGARLRTEPLLRDEKGRIAPGRFTPDHLGGLVEVSLSIDPVRAIGHETIHVLRDHGLFTDREWSDMEHAAIDNDWKGEFDIRRRYPDLSEEALIEEAIAEKFGAWLRDRTSLDKRLIPKIAKPFQRIRLFFLRLGASLSARGHTKAKASMRVFEDIYSGSVRRRKPKKENQPVATAIAYQKRIPFHSRLYKEIASNPKSPKKATLDGWMEYIRSCVNSGRVRTTELRDMGDLRSVVQNRWIVENQNVPPKRIPRDFVLGVIESLSPEVKVVERGGQEEAEWKAKVEASRKSLVDAPQAKWLEGEEAQKAFEEYAKRVCKGSENAEKELKERMLELGCRLEYRVCAFRLQPFGEEGETAPQAVFDQRLPEGEVSRLVKEGLVSPRMDGKPMYRPGFRATTLRPGEDLCEENSFYETSEDNRGRLETLAAAKKAIAAPGKDDWYYRKLARTTGFKPTKYEGSTHLGQKNQYGESVISSPGREYKIEGNLHFNDRKKPDYQTTSQVVYVRHSIRKVKGERTLFIEEVQSDTHQPSQKKKNQAKKEIPKYEQALKTIKGEIMREHTRERLEEAKETLVNPPFEEEPWQGSENWAGLALAHALELAATDPEVKAVAWADGPSMENMEWRDGDGPDDKEKSLSVFYERVLPRAFKRRFKSMGWKWTNPKKQALWRFKTPVDEDRPDQIREFITHLEILKGWPEQFAAHMQAVFRDLDEEHQKRIIEDDSERKKFESVMRNQVDADLQEAERELEQLKKKKFSSVYGFVFPFTPQMRLDVLTAGQPKYQRLATEKSNSKEMEKIEQEEPLTPGFSM